MIALRELHMRNSRSLLHLALRFHASSLLTLFRRAIALQVHIAQTQSIQLSS